MADGTRGPGDKETRVVYISGQRYAVRTDADPDYLERLARYVEERYEQIVASGRSVPAHKAAILTALRLADELFRQKEEKRKLKENIRLRSQKILAMIDSLKR